MEDSSKMITVVVSIIMASVVTFGAIKNKNRRQNGILNRAIKKTEYQSIACYCVNTMHNRKKTKASILQRSTCFKKYKCIENAQTDCSLRQNNQWEKCPTSHP
jgi:hypothetical protein